MKHVRFIIGGIVIAYIVGMLAFVNASSKYLSRPPSDSADLAIVLTGGNGRIKAGLNLLQSEVIERLFISGVNKSVTIETLLSAGDYNKIVDKSKINCCIFLGYRANNTFENALESSDFIKQSIKFSSTASMRVYLITGIYHMNRSMLEMSAALNNVGLVKLDVEIIPVAIVNKNIKLDNWYLDLKTINVIIKEYTKTIAVVLRSGFEIIYRLV